MKHGSDLMGSKTARACDSCVRKRARWYCAADDAFLCQGCDTSVHSANQLASRHERLRLGTTISPVTQKEVTPAWHNGFTRKPRTPRHAKKITHNINILCDTTAPNVDPLVPEMNKDEEETYENEENLLCQVPVLDPFNFEEERERAPDFEDLHGFFQSEMDLAVFDLDVETIFNDSCMYISIESGLLGFKVEADDTNINSCFDDKLRNVKEEKDIVTLLLNEDTSHGKSYSPPNPMMTNSSDKVQMFLKLNYEAIVNTWDTRGSPWTTGTRPELKPGDCWPHCLGICPKHGYGYGGRGSESEREARVSRYREKRRSRLFSKKIRYQVRKLNAETRPRIKGRFVKRTSVC